MSGDPRDVRQFGHYYDDDDDDDVYEQPIRYFMFKSKRYDITQFLNEFNMKFEDDNGVEQIATDNGKVDEKGRVLFRVKINGVETDVVIKEEQTKPVPRSFVRQKATRSLTGGRKKSRKSRKGRKGKKSRKNKRRTKRR